MHFYLVNKALYISWVLILYCEVVFPNTFCNPNPFQQLFWITEIALFIMDDTYFIFKSKF